jgi:hypothetical protein
MPRPAPERPPDRPADGVSRLAFRPVRRQSLAPRPRWEDPATALGDSVTAHAAAVGAPWRTVLSVRRGILGR